ncbi:MAG TPA: translesion error-prone DNA polymerase V autoproteolytic subunit [Capillibacterium sp.]
MRLTLFSPGQGPGVVLPAAGHISAGFPSPADDYLEAALDLNQLLIKHPSATFYGRAQGDSMAGAGVENGDLLVIDRAVPYRPNALAVCYLDGEFTLKRLRKEGEDLYLVPANPKYPPLKLREGDDFAVWGIVTYVIKKVY